MTTQADLDLGTHKVVTDERVKERNRLQRMLIRPEMGAAIGAIGLFIIFFVVAPPFREAASLTTVLYASSTIGIMACGVALLMIGGEFDLSAGVAVTFSSLAASMLAYNLHLNLWAGAGLALILALSVGFLNGYLVMKTKIPSFLITLSSFFMIAGINLAVTKLVSGQVATQSVNDMQGWDSAHLIFASSIPVFGVEIPRTGGRAGMAAVKLRDGADFDGEALAETVYSRLPVYALPLFLRIVDSMEHTTTFKSRKVDLREQAYGADIEDPLYVLAGRDEGYVPFYDDYPDDVASGKRPQG